MPPAHRAPRGMRTLPGGAPLGALAVACAALAQHQSPRDGAPPWVLCAMLLAIVAAALAFPSPVEIGPHPAGERPLSMHRARRAILALLVTAIPAALIWDREPFRTTDSFVTTGSSWAALLWLGGMLAALLLCRHERLEARVRRTPTRPCSLHYLEAALLAAILVLALALRTWHLGSLPYGVWFDEVDSAANARALLHLPFQPYAPGNYGHNPSLYFYLMAALLQIGGNGIGTIRLTSAIFGVLGVLAAYLIGRRVGGTALGLSAAALIAMAAWSITFSRVAMPDIAAPAMVGLAIGALCYALSTPTPFWFLLAGLGLGLSLLTYQGAFLPVLAALALTAGRLRLDAPFRQQALSTFWVTLWLPALFLPLGVLVGALPLLVASHLDPTYATARVSSVSITHEYADWAHLLPALLRNVQRHALMFTASGDLNGRQNLPGAPMLDPLTGTLFLLGLGICLRHISRWFYALLLLWLGASMLGGILSLSGDAPHGARSIGALVPAALIAALPLALAMRVAFPPPPRASNSQSGLSIAPYDPSPVPPVLPAAPSRPAGTHDASCPPHALPGPKPPQLLRPASNRQEFSGVLVLIVLLLALFGLNTDRYFNRQATNIQSWTAMDGRRALAGHAAAASLSAGYSVRVDPLLTGGTPSQYPVLRFDAGRDLTILDPAHPVPSSLPPGGLALIISADDPGLYRRIRHAYPAAHTQALTPSFDRNAVQAWLLLLR